MDIYEGYTVKKHTEKINISNEIVYRSKKRTFIKDFICLDTETSHHCIYNTDGSLDKEKSKTWIYQWALCNQNDIVYGRYPSDIVYVYQKLIEQLELSKFCTLITYIHNASYDLSYLLPFFIQAWGIPKIIAIENHHIISATFEEVGLQFRCSYKLSNKSLAKWSNDYNTLHKKLEGYVDYNKVYYPSEPLDNKNWMYQFNDVIVLRECLLAQMSAFNHHTNNIPLTSTGYIREKVYKSYQLYNDNNYGKARSEFRENEIDKTLYTNMRREQAGGITHGNRHIVNKTIRNDNKHFIKHRDFESHYPTQEIIHTYPIGKWYIWFDGLIQKQPSVNTIRGLSKKNCLLIKCIITNLELKDKKEALPFAQYSKFNIECKKGTKFTVDNGRILSMQGTTVVTLTDIDFFILCKQYNFKVKFIKIYTSKRGPLPVWLTDVIKQLYADKTNYKRKVKEIENTKGICEELYQAKIELLIVKALLNAIYGMSASDLVREEYTIDDIGNWNIKEDTKKTDQYIEKELHKYYKGFKNCMRLEWGLWCTSWARYELYIEYWNITTGFNGKCEKGFFLYADTDSIFYISNDSLEKEMELNNARKKKESLENGWYTILNDGTKHTFNAFEDEKDDIQAFRYTHAKCYALELGKEHKLQCTIAGVPERILTKDGKWYTRHEELKNINNLNDDMIFEKCGGTSCTYINHEIEKININGHIVETAGGSIIRKTTKSVSVLKVFDC